MGFHSKLDPIFIPASGAELIFEQHLDELMRHPGAEVLVSEEADGVVGFITGIISSLPPQFSSRKRGFVTALQVHGNHQRYGHGGQLLKEMMAWFDRQGIPRVEVQVSTLNPEALNFWKEKGFEEYSALLVKSTS